MKRVTLFLAILCASQLYGMEQSSMESLPKDFKAHIITCSHTYENINDIIKTIKAISLTNQEFNYIVSAMYGNQEGFTVLVHILANKFRFKTSTVARMFDTPVSKKYLQLGHELIAYTVHPADAAHNKVISLIKQGADVNFYSDQGTPLQIAVTSKKVEKVLFLLENKANPKLALARATAMFKKDPDNKATAMIREIIEHASNT